MVQEEKIKQSNEAEISRKNSSVLNNNLSQPKIKDTMVKNEKYPSLKSWKANSI